MNMLKLAWAADRRHRVICPLGLVVCYLVSYEYKDITPGIRRKLSLTKVDILFNSAIQIEVCIRLGLICSESFLSEVLETAGGQREKVKGERERENTKLFPFSCSQILQAEYG